MPTCPKTTKNTRRVVTLGGRSYDWEGVQAGASRMASVMVNFVCQFDWAPEQIMVILCFCEDVSG